MSRLSSVLSPYTKNKNTGNLYEIATALTLLRRMGVTNAEFEADAALLETIAVYNDKKSDELRALFVAVRAVPVGSGSPISRSKGWDSNIWSTCSSPRMRTQLSQWFGMVSRVD